MSSRLLTKLPKLLRAPVLWVFALALALSAIGYLLTPGERHPPPHAIYLTANGLYSLWEQPIERVGYYLAASDDSCAYGAYDDAVYCTDVTTGWRRWSHRLNYEHGPTRAVIATEQAVYAVGTEAVDALKASSGLPLWSTFLGYGHVGVVAQLEPAVLRVYYGDRILDLDLETGVILRSRAMSDVLWIEGDVEVHCSVEGQASAWAVDETGATIWRSPQAPFTVSEAHPPLSISSYAILALTEDERLCRFDVGRGQYDWCLAPSRILAFGLRSDRKIGFALTDSTTVVAFDMAYGRMITGTQFLPPPTPNPSGVGATYDYAVAPTALGVLVRLDDTSQVFSLRLPPDDPNAP